MPYQGATIALSERLVLAPGEELDLCGLAGAEPTMQFTLHQSPGKAASRAFTASYRRDTWARGIRAGSVEVAIARYEPDSLAVC